MKQIIISIKKIVDAYTKVQTLAVDIKTLDRRLVRVETALCFITKRKNLFPIE